MRGASRITLVAGGMLVGAGWMMGSFGLLAERRGFVEILTQIIAVLLVVLGWRYRRNRLAVAALLVTGSSLLLRSGAVVGATNIGVLALFIAADVAGLGISRDRPLLQLPGLIWIPALGLQLWAVTAGAHRIAAFVPPAISHPAVVPAVVFGAAVAVVAIFVIRRGAFEASLVWVAVAFAAVFTSPQGAHGSSPLLAAAALVLLVGFFEDSYRLAYHDELTGLPGRRALDETLRDLSGAFTIAMVDIDHFKRFNDRWGHDAGDQVLRMVADELARVGGSGRAYRYGGEEFAIVFPGAAASESRQPLEALRRSIAGRAFSLRGPDRPKRRPDKPKKGRRPAKTAAVTVSIGLAGADSRRKTADAVIRAADTALYRAKNAGRNRVVAAGERLKS
ncbi:MAG: GGDEF domain-containing protein [Thermoanaerobaculales bacterium]|jgi:diguanylate cyclase (GGDEF)-like protein|nr:GGDEF domain-containing protein [Thermoanaerobaculales bacterium]